MNKRIKVLMTADSYGGVWTFVMELVKGLKDKADFLIAVMGKPLSTSQISELSRLNNILLHQSNFKLEWMQNPWSEVDESGKWLLELKEKFQPDIMHLNGYSHGSLNSDIPVIITAHSCVFSWWINVNKTSAPEFWNEYRYRVTEGLMNVDMITAPSAAMMNYINMFYGKFRNQRVIYNGLNPYDFRISPKQEFVFSMGRLWDEAKNISAAANIASKLKWPLYIAGDASDPTGKNNKVKFNVKHLGILSREMVSVYLSYASIFAHPAKYEPFGLSPLEAAFSGSALVLGDIDSLKEIWEDNALYVNPENEDLLADTINNLISDKRLRLLYSRKANTHAMNFRSAAMCSEYFSAYTELLKLYDNTRKELLLVK